MNVHAKTDQPLAGFPAPVHDAHYVFRCVLDAMSHPGKIVSVSDQPDAPHPLHKSAAAICMSLVDFETPLWADSTIAASGQALAHLRFHCGCPVTSDPQQARTALVSDLTELKALDRFNIGTDERPDLSTTVIVQVAGMKEGLGVKLTGPGINGESHLDIAGATHVFWDAVRTNNDLFPRGVDLILATDNAIVCLPRTTRVES